MKCPKCGYLGFETTDRCRNCGYDFSLASIPPPTELPLRTDPVEAALADFDLRTTSASDAIADLEAPAPPAADEAAAAATPGGDLPLFAPRPAGTPLSVRRAGGEVPRARRTTTRPLRGETPALPLVPAEPAAPASTDATQASSLEPAGLGPRVAAAAIDLTLLVAIDLVVLWMTLRLAGLAATLEDLAVIRPVPMAAFLFVLAFLYLVGFTIGGGQTIGKMLTGIRVMAESGRGVDLTSAVVRALGSLAAVATLGLLYLPVCISPERRAPHDRLAGTRVVVA